MTTTLADTTAERIQRSILVDDNGCWLWQLRKTPKGYGEISYRGRTHRAHRVAYEVYVGPLPQGLQLDHLCRVRACCNPAHLEPVTNAENIRRGMAPNQITRRTGICQRGHAIAGANLKHKADGGRQCRECQNVAKRRYQARQRA